MFDFLQFIISLIAGIAVLILSVIFTIVAFVVAIVMYTYQQGKSFIYGNN
jgi:hypothetical protein